MVIRGAKSRMQECQTRGWSEKGHKVECKILKVVRGIQVRDGDLIS
jgi:F420-0:gamma-glutamyl ligase-like protein